MPVSARLTLVAVAILAVGSRSAMPQEVKPHPCNLGVKILADGFVIGLAGRPDDLWMRVHAKVSVSDSDQGAHGMVVLGVRVSIPLKGLGGRPILLDSEWTEAQGWPPSDHTFDVPPHLVSVRKIRNMVKLADVMDADHDNLRVEIVAMATDQEGCVATDRFRIKWPQLLSKDAKEGDLSGGDLAEMVLTPTIKDCALQVKFTAISAHSNSGGISGESKLKVTDDDSCFPVHVIVSYGAIVFTKDGTNYVVSLMGVSNQTSDSGEKSLTYGYSGQENKSGVVSYTSDQVSAAFASESVKGLGSPKDRAALAASLLTADALVMTADADASDACNCTASDSTSEVR